MFDATECNTEVCKNITNVTTHWLEKEAVAGFRIWQIMFICFAGVLTLIIMLCCCIRFRIPRTKQEIEADYIRKKITKKFQKQLRMIRNADMDDMDLKRALDRIRAEFKSDTESLAQSDALSGATLSSCNYRIPGDLGDGNYNCTDTYRKASDIGKSSREKLKAESSDKRISLEEIMEKESRGIIKKFPTFVGRIAKLHSFKKPRTNGEQ